MSDTPLVVVVTNIPTPYRIPLFNEVARQVEATGRRFRVIFCNASYSRRKWDAPLDEARFDYEVLTGRVVRLTGEKSVHLPWDLGSALARLRPSLVVTAGFSLPTVLAWRFCRSRRVPMALWSGETADEASRQRLMPVKTWLRRRIARQARSAIAYGSAARDYLMSIGLEERRIVRAFNTVDTTFFSRQVATLRESRSSLRTEHGVPDDPAVAHVLFVGYLIERKGLQHIVRSLARLQAAGHRAVLHIVGDGDYRPTLEALVAELSLPDVQFWGFRQKPELPTFYAMADAFVLPSEHELWGLVLNEAMAAGLPSVVSDTVGAAVDLLIEGETGFLIPITDPAKVDWALGQMLQASRSERQQMGERAAEVLLHKASVGHGAAAWVDAVELALSPTSRAVVKQTGEAR